MLTDESDKHTRIIFCKRLILLGIFFAFAIGILYIYVYQSKNYQPPVIIVDTEYVQQEDSIYNDDIGDFLLQHEYFAADIEALNEENTTKPAAETPAVNQEDIEKKPHEPRIILDSLTLETPLIAVVVDDMGVNRKGTNDILSLQAPLTSSFLTYGKNLAQFAAQAHAAGHEIMIHAPMEPKVPAELAPDTLQTGMNESEIKQIFNNMLDKFEQISVRGINNHMGSKFTEDKEKLGYIMNILKQHQMFFLDSKTTAYSKGRELAIEDEVDFATRDVFLDNENNYEYIMGQLHKAEKIATTKGFAIAICHPKSQTYLALKDWIAALPGKNLKLVHVSEIVKAINP